MNNNDANFSADMIRDIMNNYILFYKSEIENVNLFKGIDTDDVASTNIQMEALYAEMHEFSKANEQVKEMRIITELDNQLNKFVICKNEIPYCTSELLFSVLIEIINLKAEDPQSDYKIKLKVNIEKKKK
jgi:hypothetical protein